MKTLKEILQASGDLYPDVAPQGWECPKCHRVYSPNTPMCWYCGNTDTVATTVTVTTGGDEVTEELYCDRNQCKTMELNGKDCSECPIAKNYNLEDDDSPCLNCEEV